MKDDDKRDAIGVALFAIVGALILTGLFGGKESFTGKWLYNYQTLVTGLLALGAAFFTVRQMQRTDQKNDEQHMRLIEAQLRPYALKVERLCKPNIPDLIFYSERIQLLGFAPRLAAGETGQERLKYRRWLGDAIGLCSELEQLLLRPCWKEDGEVLGGWAKYLHQEMNSTCSAVSDAIGRQLDFIEKLEGPATKFVGQEEANMAEADYLNIRKMIELEEMCGVMVGDLRSLAKLYDVDVSEFDD